MYSWKISTKFIWTYIIQFSIYLVAFIATVGVLFSYAESFKKEMNAEYYQVEINIMQKVYARYESDFGISPGRSGVVMFAFYDENGENIVVDRDTASKYVEFNIRTDNLFSIMSLTSSIQFFIALILLMAVIVLRRSKIFSYFMMLGSLCKLFTSFGVNYYFYAFGVALEFIALVLILIDYFKIKNENYKIEHRKEIYS